MGDQPNAPMAMCPRCVDVPLVLTFERSGYEFTCVECGGWFDFLAPHAAAATPERMALLADVEERYDTERSARSTP